MGRARSLVVVLMLAWVATGCEQLSLSEDAGPSEMDAGHSEDGGSGDATLDAQPPLDDGGQPDAALGDPDAALDGGGCACDDGIACTRDTCGAGGACEHTPVHVDCGAGQYCDVASGCRAGAICATTADCVRPDVCVTVVCSTATRLCVYSPLDGDADGYPPVVCGGDDCDDGNPAVNPGVAIERCDGVDSDCSGGPEPVDAPPCERGFVCGATACECPAPSSICPLTFFDTYCTDLATDEENCGRCHGACGAGQLCVAGECTCTTGTLCGADCVDLATSNTNCGGCFNWCGEGTCDSGSCTCAPGEVYCADPRGAECAVLATDERHCGACSDPCPIYATCVGGTCSVTGTSVRAWGVSNGGGGAPDRAVFASFDPTTEATYVAAQTWGGRLREMTDPVGPEVGDSGSTHVVKLDAAGNILWQLTSFSLSARGVAHDAGRVWLVGTFTTATATLGSSTFSRGVWSGASVVMIELDATNGALITSRTVPAGSASALGNYYVAAGGGEVVFTGTSGNNGNFGGAAIPAGTFVARYAPGLVHLSSFRHPGVRPHGIRIGPTGETVSFGFVTGSVTFGTTTINSPASWVARWASDGTLLGAFGGQPNATAIAPISGGMWVAAASEPSLQLWTFTGTTATPGTATPAGWSTVGWQPANLQAQGGDLYVDVMMAADGAIDGHAVAAGQPFIMRIDATTTAVERIAAISARHGIGYSRWISSIDASDPGRIRIAGLLPPDLQIGGLELNPTSSDAFYIAELAMTP